MARSFLYRILKGGWFRGGGYKESLGDSKGIFGSTRENSGSLGYLPPLDPPPLRIP